jgi:hypothetical protein
MIPLVHTVEEAASAWYLLDGVFRALKVGTVLKGTGWHLINKGYPRSIAGLAQDTCVPDRSAANTVSVR